MAWGKSIRETSAEREAAKTARMRAQCDAMMTAKAEGRSPVDAARVEQWRAEAIKSSQDIAKVFSAPKVPDRVNKSLRASARGEDCLVRIPGVCSGDPTHTIWSHAPLGAAGKGRGIKALDLCGAYCCVECDSVIDGQAPLPPGYTKQQAMLDWHEGHLRSLVRARQLQII